MYIKFVSDNSVTGTGFSAIYKAQTSLTCLEFVIGISGSLTSPGYPQDYANDLDCTWVLGSPTETIIKLIFESFDVEAESDCGYDVVEVFDGVTEINSIGRYRISNS